MEENESEKCLITLREHMAEFLDNISDIGSAIKKRSDTLLSEIANTNHTNVSKLESVGLGMIKMLNTLNINILDITNLLQHDLEEVNENRREILFVNLSSKVREYRNSFVIDSVSNNVAASKINGLEKNIQTDWFSAAPNTCDTPPKLENCEIKYENKADTIPIMPYGIRTEPTDLEMTKAINLGLLRNDTEDTDDCWIDSINRKTTGLELWDTHPGLEVNATGECLNNLKEEQAEDTEWDRKTEDLNYECDRHLSSGDEAGMDEETTKTEAAPVIELNTQQVKAETREQLEERITMVTNEIHDPSSQSNKEETVSNEKEQDSENLDFNNELHEKGVSVISNEIADRKDIDDSNTQDNLGISYSSTNIDENRLSTTYSEQIIPNISESNVEQDVEQNETIKSDIGSHSVTSTDTFADKETEQCGDISDELNINENQSAASRGEQLPESCLQNSEKVNINSLDSLDDNVAASLIEICDHLETVASVAFEYTDSDFQDTDKLAQDSIPQNDCSNKQILEESKPSSGQIEENVSDRPSSEITYSQETVELNNSDQVSQINEMSDGNNLNSQDAANTSCTTMKSQIVDSFVEKALHLYSKKSSGSESDETDTDENTDTLPITQLLAHIASNSETAESENNLSRGKDHKSYSNDNIDTDQNDEIEHLPSKQNTIHNSNGDTNTSTLPTQVIDHSKDAETIHLSSEKNKKSDSEKIDIGGDVNTLVTSKLPEEITNADDKSEHLSSEENNVPDSDETDIDDDVNTGGTSELPEQIADADNKNEHLSSEENNVPNGNETNIDEHVEGIKHLSSKKGNVLESDETDTDDDVNTRDRSDLSQHIANADDKTECRRSDENNVPDSDETDIDEDVEGIKHLSSKKGNVLDSDETDIDDDLNTRGASKLPQQVANVDNNNEHLSYEENNVPDSDETDIDENVEGIKNSSSKKGNVLESDETDIDDDVNTRGTSELPQVAHVDNKNEHLSSEENNVVPDSDEPDIDEVDIDYSKGIKHPSSVKKNKRGSDETANSTKDDDDANITEHLSLEKSKVQGREETNIDEDKDTLLISKHQPENLPIVDDVEIHKDNLSMTKSNAEGNRPQNDEINTNVDIENDFTIFSQETVDLNEESALKGSNQSLVFDISENINIEGDSECSDVPSLKKLDIAEENSPRSTENSFVFDITENFNHLGQNIEKSKATAALSVNDESKQKENKSTDGTKQLIELLSDSDDDVHLDVTMEEIVCNGSAITAPETINKKRGSQSSDIKMEIIKEVEIRKEVEEVEEGAQENNEEEPKILTTQQLIGDELLELLREVEIPSVAPLNECTRNVPKTNIKNDIKEADEIFKMLQEESASDLSDSEVSDNMFLSGSDSELIENISKNQQLTDTKDEGSQQSDIKDSLQEVTIRDCYVSLKKLQLDVNEVVKINRNFDSIDRLCDIDNIGKRQHSKAQKAYKSKKVKKQLVAYKGTSDSESISDYSHSDSDNAPDNSLFSTKFSPRVEQKLDDLLANEICKELKDNLSDESTDVDSDDSVKHSEKAKDGDKGKTVSDLRQKHILTKEERIKKAWKNDPLLRGKLTSDDSTSGSEKSFKIRRALRNKYELDSDFSMTEDIDSDSDNSQTNKNKMQLTDKTITPIKKKISIYTSSDTDSDIEIVASKQKTPEKKSELGDEPGPSGAQKGRRNIRALMSDESLAEATQRANKEEHERIERLEGRDRVKESLSQSFTQLEEDTLILDVDEKSGEPLVKVHPKLYKRLKPHQTSGVQFMWDSCYESLERCKVDEGSGCILAHCMGLGKTFQVITLLHTLFSYEETSAKHVLVVCPASTVNNWKNEVKIAFKNFPEDMLNIIPIVNKKEISQKYDIVKKWYCRKKSILVLGYECYETLTNEIKLEKIDHHLKERMLEALIDPGPDLVICDEGHLLRNKKALKTLAINKIRTKRRIVLTGTPLQNNLLEYYHMVNFVKPNLLGNMKEYKTNFVNPITNGQYEDSTAEDIKLMMKRTHVLHKLLKKTIQRFEDTELKIYLPKMVDHAVFIQLNQVQVDLYNKFSQLVAKNSTNTNRKGFLSDFSVFQYICTHPHLLAVMENLRNKKIKERDLITEEQDNPICNIEGWWKAVVPPDAGDRIDYGNKLVVLRSIIEECEAIGDKVLVFSQSLGELNLIEYFLEKEGTSSCPSWKKNTDYCRMDGTVPPANRSTICDLFNDKNNKKLRLLLMSTRVGGLGLNLIAANRVIIMTVNWNPSYDIQSVFRVYRFGQEKEVYVYRLIALDTMEEKVYQRTVTKLAIAHRVVDKHQITRHYKSMDLQELYSCKPDADTERPICNVPEDKVLAKLILRLPYIFKQHEHQALLANRPEDNLNEQELNAAWDEFKTMKDAPQVPPQPVQPQTSIPQTPILNGPSYSTAYDLIKPATSVTTGKRTNATADDYDVWANNYYISRETNGDMKKTTNANSSTVNQTVRNPFSIAKPLDSKGNQKTTKDPLYIPSSKKHKLGNSYSELVNKLKPSTLPKESGGKGNQKENIQQRKSVKKPAESIVILDDDSNRTNLSERIRHGIKRKRDNNFSTENLLKKMKKGFNEGISNYHVPISIDDDDDDVTEIPDTISDSGSLSNELVTNLGRSGITISKVIKDVNRNNIMGPKIPQNQIQSRMEKLFGPSSPEASLVHYLHVSPLPEITPVPALISPLPDTPPPGSPERQIPPPPKSVPSVVVRIPRWRLRPSDLPEGRRYRFRMFTPNGIKWLALPKWNPGDAVFGISHLGQS